MVWLEISTWTSELISTVNIPVVLTTKVCVCMCVHTYIHTYATVQKFWDKKFFVFFQQGHIKSNSKDINATKDLYFKCWSFELEILQTPNLWTVVFKYINMSYINIHIINFTKGSPLSFCCFFVPPRVSGFAFLFLNIDELLFSEMYMRHIMWQWQESTLASKCINPLSLPHVMFLCHVCCFLGRMSHFETAVRFSKTPTTHYHNVGVKLCRF